MPSLRFLADESCDYLIVRSLRAAGHDVIAVVDEGEQSVDAAVIDQAYVDQRILLTLASIYPAGHTTAANQRQNALTKRSG